MAMGDDETKLVSSALAGIAGFLASHVFSRLAQKGEAQDDLSAEVKVLQAQVQHLEEDIREIKQILRGQS
jgi:outer membrane murein-binding lipoprotein Lpp